MLQQRISEADVNRTALELQLLTCRQERDDAIRQLKEAQSSAEQANVEARSTREKLAGLEHELRGAKEAGGSLRNLLKTSQSDLEDVTRKLKEVQSSAELERGEATGLREGLQRAEQVERSLRDELAASYASQSDSERRIEEITQQLKDAQASIGLANADAASVQEELQRLEYELKKAKLVERSLRDELKANHASQLDTERRLEDVNRQLRDVQANADVANTKALGLHEELQQVMHELKDMKSVEGSLRVDLEAIHASHRDAEKRFQDATRQLKDAQSSTKGVQEGLRRVEDTLAEARRIEHSLREELRTSRDSQSEAEQRLDEVAQRFKDVQSGAELANTEARSMKAELRRVVQELKEARRIEGMLRDNLTLTGRVSQQDFEHRFEESNWLVDQLLDVAITFWNTHHRALQMLQSMIIAPNGQIDNLGEPGSSPNVHNGSVPQGPPSIDTADAASALQVLRGLDHDNFLDCITKVGSVIKKWQKVCKLHKERAKGKIAFRNFSKGDLALFLPTRNSKVKHWAAFNVSSPHQFLQATGHMEEQLKFREWALCRITTITERVVSRDVKTDPLSSLLILTLTRTLAVSNMGWMTALNIM
ncbi:autophagy-related protein 11-domain-containing protein [Scleroderma yunnanense]